MTTSASRLDVLLTTMTWSDREAVAAAIVARLDAASGLFDACDYGEAEKANAKMRVVMVLEDLGRAALACRREPEAA